MLPCWWFPILLLSLWDGITSREGSIFYCLCDLGFPHSASICPAIGISAGLINLNQPLRTLVQVHGGSLQKKGPFSQDFWSNVVNTRYISLPFSNIASATLVAAVHCYIQGSSWLLPVNPIRANMHKVIMTWQKALQWSIQKASSTSCTTVI